MLLGRWVAMTSRQRMVSVMAESTQEDLMHLRGLLESGALRPAIDRRYPLSAVPDAIRYMETGRARGKVVITVAPAAEA
jgi:NADPH:quinone reductase-like Zn-dependent oxidoreductase